MADWATTTIHLTAIQDVARVFTEQVVAQLVARTQGVLPRADVYRLAAPMGIVWRRKIHVHFKMDFSTLWWILWLAFKVRHPWNARGVKGSGAAATAGNEHDPAQHQRHPLRTALQWSVGEAAAAYWWVKSHQKVKAVVTKGDVRKMGKILAGAQATKALAKSVRGQRVAVPLPLQATYGARPMARGSTDMEWCIHEPSKWRPPRALHPRMGQLLRESPETGIFLVPLYLGMWHPRLQACPRCEWHEEVTTRYKCPCRRPKWRRAPHAVDPPWRLHGGASLRIISVVPRSHTCIAAEGEGTHDCAAVPADHVHMPAAMQEVEFRHWATIV